jgi:hypothetical protein
VIAAIRIGKRAPRPFEETARGGASLERGAGNVASTLGAGSEGVTSFMACPP